MLFFAVLLRDALLRASLWRVILSFLASRLLGEKEGEEGGEGKEGRGRAGKFSNSGGTSRACVSIFNARQPRWKGALWKVPFVACIVPRLPRLLILHFCTIIWFTAGYRNCATVQPPLYNTERKFGSESRRSCPNSYAYLPFLLF